MNINGKWYTETELQAYVKELEVRISVLEDKHHNECGQIAHYDDELKAAKRLLKLAVEDIRDAMRSYDPCEICFLQDDDGNCPAEDDEDCGKKYKWRYEYEALALIGGEEFDEAIKHSLEALVKLLESKIKLIPEKDGEHNG